MWNLLINRLQQGAARDIACGDRLRDTFVERYHGIWWGWRGISGRTKMWTVVPLAIAVRYHRPDGLCLPVAWAKPVSDKLWVAPLIGYNVKGCDTCRKSIMRHTEPCESWFRRRLRPCGVGIGCASSKDPWAASRIKIFLRRFIPSVCGGLALICPDFPLVLDLIKRTWLVRM